MRQPLAEDRSDLRILLAARVLRAFGFGFSAVLVAVHLQARGLSPAWIGVVLAVGLGSASFTGLAAAWLASRIGRRLTLASVGILMALCGIDLALAPTPWLLLLAGLTGMMGLANADLGPFLAVEQAMLTETATAAGRNRAFGRYSFTGAIGIAAGGLAASAVPAARSFATGSSPPSASSPSCFRCCSAGRLRAMFVTRPLSASFVGCWG